MSQPCKCDCQKLFIALLDRADALHREEIEFLQLGHADAYSKLHDLKAEVERLTKERDHYQWASTNDGIACNERARENQDLENQIDALKAEVERLRKAGDAMHLAHEANFNGYPYTQNQVEKAMKAWLAAKGVQP